MRPAYRQYLLGLLLVIQAFNYLDGLALGLVLQNIKFELSLSDTQLGLLSGIAFWLFYSVMGIPIARWADQGNRAKVISFTAALWSVMVSLCGLAANFSQLLLIRIGVAVGEAGCVPPAHSLIADYFTRAERPRAVAIYMLGGPLSTALGYFLAGWINELYGWRATFFVLGVPGILLAALARWTLREPRLEKGGEGNLSRPRGDATVIVKPTLRTVARILWKMPSFRYLLLYFSVMSFFVSGVLQWQPSFFVRSYGLKTGELGTWFALIYGLGGMLGSYLCGVWASRRAANDESRQLKVMSLIICSFSISSAVVYLSPNQSLAFALMAIAAVGGAATNGPVFAAIQTLVPDRMRATSIALIYLFANLIGSGLGPLAIGALSDAFRPWLGTESLRYALLCSCPGYLLGGWLLWRSSRTVGSDLVQSSSTSHSGHAVLVDESTATP